MRSLMGTTDEALLLVTRKSFLRKFIEPIEKIWTQASLPSWYRSSPISTWFIVQVWIQRRDGSVSPPWIDEAFASK